MVRKKNSELIVKYSAKEIMDKLEDMHTDIKVTNGTVKFHTKLIYGAYGFIMFVLGILIKHITGG